MPEGPCLDGFTSESKPTHICPGTLAYPKRTVSSNPFQPCLPSTLIQTLSKPRAIKL